MHPQNRTICDKLQTPPNLRRGEVLPLPAVRCCKFDRTNANTHAPVGADDPVRPAVGTSVFLKPIGKFAIAQRADRGVRPYREFYDFADRMCGFAIASCAGGVEPLPYGVSGNVTFFTICRGKPANAARADRGVRPYRTFYVVAEGVCNFAIAFCRVDVGIDPYGDFALPPSVVQICRYILRTKTRSPSFGGLLNYLQLISRIRPLWSRG